jgi:hypothetical protein
MEEGAWVYLNKLSRSNIRDSGEDLSQGGVSHSWNYMNISKARQGIYSWENSHRQNGDEYVPNKEGV